MKLGLDKKTVLVTGASRGIGKAIAEAFAEEGCNIAVNYVSSREKAESVVKDLKTRFGVKAESYRADMSDEDQIKSMIHSVERDLGDITVLVNNAAYCPSGPITSYSVEEWDKTFGINMRGVFVASKEMVSKWIASETKGTIVNIASQAAFKGSTSGHLPYDSSKGAMVSFTIGLAREVAHLGIRVNGVAPGLVRTEMVAETWEKRKETYLQRIPLKRISEPEEVANVALFLASDAASYITGSTVDVSGGMLMR